MPRERLSIEDCMNCRHCGAHLAPDDLVCGNCGNIVDSTPPAPTVAVRSIPRPSPARARRISATTLVILAFACGFVGLIAAAGLGGVYAGLQDRKTDEQAQADKFYQEGLANRTAGKLQLAKADFEYALKINPNYPGAREQIAQITELLTVKPTPTSAVKVNVTEQLYQAGVDAYNQKNWRKAIEVLTQVRSIDPTYKKDQTAQMIYQAALTYGQQLLQADRLEEAIAYLDQAAYLKPLPADVETQVQYARMYITARDYWNVDWEKAIESFGELYKIGPGYRDTFTRYVEAYIQYGDERTRAGDPCTAEKQYEAALRLRPTADLQTKADTARQACLTAPPSITGTNQTLAGLYMGRIAYPVFDDSGSRILAANAGDHKLYTAALGDQPEWQRNGGKMAYRVSGTGAYVIDNGNNITIAPAGAEFPTFSPDGSRVIYSLQGQLYMVNVNGTGSPIELGAGSAPAWGPKGLLAYSGCDGGSCGIMVRNPDTADPPKRLTGSPNDIPTSWSPDGFNISYYSNVSGNYDLFFVNTAGGVQQVTKNAGNNVGGGWGPDGSHIAFLSDRDGTWSLYIAKYDGTEATKIAIAPQGNWQQQRVSWVP
jgi:tetratricopeptide (TPR) repeat protein